MLLRVLGGRRGVHRGGGVASMASGAPRGGGGLRRWQLQGRAEGAARVWVSGIRHDFRHCLRLGAHYGGMHGTCGGRLRWMAAERR